MDLKIVLREVESVTLDWWKVAFRVVAVCWPRSAWRSRMWMDQLGRLERHVATSRPMPDAAEGQYGIG